MWKTTEKYLKFNSRKRATYAAIIFAISAGFFILIGTIILSKFSANATKGDGQKVLTIFDDGKKQAFRSDAKTVKEALLEQNFEISEVDSVEPSLSEELSGADYNINIYRARPVLIEDGPIRERVMSSGQSAQKVAKDANISLFDEDNLSLENSQSTVEDGVATRIKIIRAKEIWVELYGKKTLMRTQVNSIGDFLDEKKIKLGKNDELSLPKNTKIITGNSFSIWRNGVQTISAEEEIDFEIEKIEDGDKDEGFSEIKESGKKGKKQVVYEITMLSGKEISRNKISEIETKKPKKQVEIVGIKSKGPSPYTGGGNKDQWLAASGIPRQYWNYVDAIVMKESTWNPNATNSSSGACGLAQALPCEKVPGNGYDPVVSLKWMNGYVNTRYGGWAGAYTFWMQNRWY